MFVCTANNVRSRTCEEVYRQDPRFEVKSAGLHPDSKVRLNDTLLEWADYTIVMEKMNRISIRIMFSEVYHRLKIICLYIPSQYKFMQPELVDLVKSRVGLYF